MKVEDIMTVDVASVDIKDSLAGALALMNSRDIRRLPVMRDGQLAGIIVKYDIEKSLRTPGIVLETPVEWIMNREVYIVGPDDEVLTAARILVDKRVTGLPVIKGGKMVGIISDRDLLKQLISMLESQS